REQHPSEAVVQDGGRAVQARKSAGEAARDAAPTRDLRQERQGQVGAAPGGLEVHEVQLIRAVGDERGRELARFDLELSTGPEAHASAAHVDRRDDHHGRRRASAEARGYRSGDARTLRITTRLRPGSTSATPSWSVDTIAASSPPSEARALRANASSSSTLPFHTIASPPTRRNGRRYSAHAASVPTARAVPTSYAARRSAAWASVSARSFRTSTSVSPRRALVSSRNRDFFPTDSMQVSFTFGIAMRSASPGKPAPLPTSTTRSRPVHTRTAHAVNESRKCFIATASSSMIAVRFTVVFRSMSSAAYRSHTATCALDKGTPMPAARAASDWNSRPATAGTRAIVCV